MWHVWFGLGKRHFSIAIEMFLFLKKIAVLFPKKIHDINKIVGIWQMKIDFSSDLILFGVFKRMTTTIKSHSIIHSSKFTKIKIEIRLRKNFNRIICPFVSLMSLSQKHKFC